MARFLGQQLAAASSAAAAARRAVAEPEAMTSVPISARRAAQLAAGSARADAPAPTVAPDWSDDDETPTLILPRRPDVDAEPAPALHAMPGGASSPRPVDRAPAATSQAVARPAPVQAPAPSPAPAARQVGRFTGLKRQGRTEAGTLYRATDPKTGREVAVHLLHGPSGDSDALRQRLLQQLRAAARLSHPNIAVVEEVDVDDDQPFLVGPVVDGETLPARLQTQGPLPIHAVVLLGLQLARALDHAHRQGILHRDLKPSNVLVLGDGQTLQVSGFGIAAPADAPGDVTVLGPAAGARQYMTPEQTRGEPQDARSDVFAAGVILYEMLAGERPFRGSTLLALASRIATEEPSPLQRVRPDVPPALRRIVERCLSKAPAQRYASARELADALLRVVNEVETVELAGSRPRGLPLRARWAAIAATAVALIVGAAAAAAAFWQIDAIRVQADEQGRRLVEFAAAQHAQQVLDDDWDAVATQLLPAAQAWQGGRFAVVDANGIVRVATEPGLVGQAYRAGDTTQRIDYEAPIQVQGKSLGRMIVGLPAASFMPAGANTGWLLALIAATAALAAAAVAYVLAGRLAAPIATASESLAEIAKGRFDVRVPESRGDEFGRLFTAIDALALALQRREDGQDKSKAPV